MQMQMQIDASAMNAKLQESTCKGKYNYTFKVGEYFAPKTK